MNRIRKFIIDRGLSNPKNYEEAVHVYNKRTKSILDNYKEEVRLLDRRIDLPAEFNQFGDGYKPNKQVASSMWVYKPVPFISKKSYAYVTPEYDLLTVNRFLNSEPIFNRVVKRYVEQMIRKPFDIVSQSKENLDIVKNRIRDLEVIMSGPNPGKWTWNKFIEQLATSLVTYGNAYVHRKKSTEKSSGQPWYLFGHSDSKQILPIAGLFIEDPVKMHPQMNQDGRIREWVSDSYVYYMQTRQFVHNSPSMIYNNLRFALLMRNQYTNRADPNYIWYETDEIDHIKGPASMEGLTLAMPMVWPIMADIKALRMLEENVEFLIYQFSTGILHGKVGNDQQPPQPGEVNAFQDAIDKMEGNGSIVTPHRWTLDMIASKGDVVNIRPYLDWFLDRIMMGFGTNPAVMGLNEGGGKTVSASQTVSFQSSVALFQATVANYITALFDHFLYESGKKFWDINGENRVYYVPPEIDINNRVLNDNNTIQKWINNTITFNETRVSLGYPPMPENEDKFFKDFVTAEQQEQQADLQLRAIQEQTKLAAKTKANQQSNSNKVKPANQRGKKVGPKTRAGG